MNGPDKKIATPMSACGLDKDQSTIAHRFVYSGLHKADLRSSVTWYTAAPLMALDPQATKEIREDWQNRENIEVINTNLNCPNLKASSRMLRK
ncbi:hypothetical protein AHF37_03844 [Paragonimus kellicotti]|nr:hypothetical protein AHF37_03844 [Paragonimus kellicotti]